MATRKIALIGPESSGKTTLTLQLAHYFAAPFISEFARQYLVSGGEINSAKDLVWLAKKQSESENQILKNKNTSFLFCDTDLHNIVVWSQVVFHQIEPELIELEEKQNYDFYFLLRPDIPWVNDGLRQSPHLREKLFAIYRARLIEKNRPYVEIFGNQTARFETCVAHLKLN